jgi:hypothetical protein
LSPLNFATLPVAPFSSGTAVHVLSDILAV